MVPSPSRPAGPSDGRPAIRMSGWAGAFVVGGPAAQQGKPPAPPAPAHQGGAVKLAIGLTSASTSTSSRVNFAKARQAATSISLS